MGFTYNMITVLQTQESAMTALTSTCIVVERQVHMYMHAHKTRITIHAVLCVIFVDRNHFEYASKCNTDMHEMLYTCMVPVLSTFVCLL